MSTTYRFLIFMAVSLLVVVAILGVVLRRRHPKPAHLWLAALVVGPLGMVIAKGGAGLGAPWWLYYSVPFLLTVAFPPIVLRMTLRETAFYLVLAALSAPAIHVVFSLTLGWREYMPFLRFP